MNTSINTGFFFNDHIVYEHEISETMILLILPFDIDYEIVEKEQKLSLILCKDSKKVQTD